MGNGSAHGDGIYHGRLTMSQGFNSHLLIIFDAEDDILFYENSHGELKSAKVFLKIH